MFLESFSWQNLIVFSCLLTTLSVTINKHQSHRASSLQVLSSKYTGSLTVALSWWLITSRIVPSNWFWLFIYGAFIAISLTLYTRAQRISMSQTSMVQPIGHILGMLMATVILGEWSLFSGLHAWKLWLAMGLIPAFFWSFYEPDNYYSKKWIKLMSVYLLASAMFKVMTKVFLNISGVTEVLIFQYLGSLIAISLVTMLRGQKLVAGKKFALKGWLQGLIGGSGILLYYTAVAKATVTQTTLVRTPLLTLLSVLVGLILFKEARKMSRKKWLGVVVAGVITWLVATH